MGYSPWGRKELDTTEQLHSLTHLGLTYKGVVTSEEKLKKQPEWLVS